MTMFSVMRVPLFVVLLLLSDESCVKGADKWNEIQPGLRVRTFSGRTETNRPIRLTAVETSPDLFDIKVLNSYKVLGSATAFTNYSLEDLFVKTKPLVIINGGATDSFALPIPVGLVVTDGVMTSRRENSGARPLSAIVCFGLNGRTWIGSAHDYMPFQCENAVQSSPLLFDSGQSGEPSYRSRAVASRSVVALTSNQKVVFIRSEPVELKDLRKFLKESGEGFIGAMCLDGDSSSGLIAISDGTPGSARPFKVGSTASLVASAIIVLPKVRTKRR